MGPFFPPSNPYLPAKDDRVTMTPAFIGLALGLALTPIASALLLEIVTSALEKTPEGFLLAAICCLPTQSLIVIPTLLALVLIPGPTSSFAVRCGLINWKWDYLKEVPLLFAGCVFPLTLATAGGSYFLLRYFGFKTTNPLELLLSRTGFDGLILVYAVAVFIAPFAEELAFRRVFFGFLRPRVGVGTAWIVASLAFAAIHAAPSQILPMFILGLFAQMLYLRHNSILPGVALHFLNNFAVMTPFLFVDLPARALPATQ